MPKTIHTNEYIKIVGKLKQARLDFGLTQKDAAVRIKKPQSYVSKVESGEQRIDILELKSFAKIYNKKIYFFVK
jgi:transcriptional regulator with XRE-family HTH domain